MPRPKGFADPQYLQLTVKLFNQIKQRSYTLMQVQGGQKVLDAGCGAGVDTLALAEIVGARGEVTGIDVDDDALAEARARAAKAGLGPNVRHEHADVLALPYPASAFHAVRAERLFQYVADPARALSELARVTKRGGRVVAVDTDWSTFSIDTPEPATERALARVIAERVLPNGYAARQLWRLFVLQGLADLSVDMIPLYVTDLNVARHILPLEEAEARALADGLLSAEDVARWRAALEETDEHHLFLGGVNVVLMAGRKM
jgi:ubiquinone/menaquinone biosynthesis C-methylase UbiE